MASMSSTLTILLVSSLLFCIAVDAQSMSGNGAYSFTVLFNPIFHGIDYVKSDVSD
jgi:hypothetical protein